MKLLPDVGEPGHDPINPKQLKLYFQDSECLPHIKKREHILEFDKDYSKSEFIEASGNYRGYKESDEVCKWLTELFGEEVMLIRS